MFYTEKLDILQNFKYATEEVSHMDGFERRKQKKLAQIYTAAIELFFKYGFQKISVNEIAQQAKVSPATIYNYFGTKEQLYADSLFYWMDKQLQHYESILNAELTFVEKTKQIMLLEAENLKKLTNELPQLSSQEQDDMLKSMDDYAEQKLTDFFKKYVALGRKEGYISKSQSAVVIMRYFMLFQRELSRYWRESTPELTTTQQELDHMLQLFFYGLAGDRQVQ